jgi:hypothetical protein
MDDVKNCGNCRWLERSANGNNKHECKVYSFARWPKDKACRNWKEKKDDTSTQ